MKITTRLVTDAETVGQSTEISHDRTWAKFILHAEGKRAIEATGTPRQLRAFARNILEALKRERR